MNKNVLPYTHPWMIYLEITSKCNFRCEYCYNDESRRKDLTNEEIRNILIPQLKECKVETIVFIGGEPLLRLEDIIELSVDFMSISTLKEVCIATNGYLLTEDVYNSLMKAYGSNIIYFAIPLDSLNEDLVKRYRKPKEDVFSRTMDAIRLLKRKKSFMTIEMVATRENFNEIDKMMNFVRSLGSRALMEIYPYYPQENDNKVHLSLSTEQLQKLDEIKLKNLGNPILPCDFSCAAPFYDDTIKSVRPVTKNYHAISIGCIAGHSQLCIKSDGDIIPCNFLRNEVVGNVLSDTIMNIYETNPTILKLRNREVKGKCLNCKYTETCGGCRTRALSETGDMFGGVPSCQATVDWHLHEVSANKNLVRVGKRFKKELILYEITKKFKKISNVFKKKIKR
jgi:radical SAM protein with 4Fe4S-binding SPASM domain